jgi:GntR family transcriptional repressor for pyruvate dehydrogenase complex
MCNCERVLHTTWQQAALFRPVPREPLVPQIVDQLREHIVLGALRESDRLPSLRQLARLFGVSIPTMRAAIQALAYLGVVKVSHGVGTFVSQGKASARADIAGLRRASPGELIELRGLLEVHAAKLMATAMRQDAANAAFSELHVWAWERTYRQGASPEEFLRADAQFHGAILAGAGSAYAASLHGQVCARLASRLRAQAGRHRNEQELGRLHWALLDAIEHGHPERAAIAAARIAGAEGSDEPPRR